MTNLRRQVVLLHHNAYQPLIGRLESKRMFKRRVNFIRKTPIQRYTRNLHRDSSGIHARFVQSIEGKISSQPNCGSKYGYEFTRTCRPIRGYVQFS